MATQNPLVSIVVPTYNHGHVLKEAIQSLLLQTYPYWEAFIINNYSEDNTVEVVEKFAEPRIELVNFRNYGVIAASRNEGMRRARGEYIAFLDSDDVWKPTKLERCIEEFNSGCDVVCHGTIWSWEDGRTREVLHGPSEAANYESLLYQGNRLATSCTVVVKEVLEKVGGFSTNQDFVTAEDYELWLRISKANYHFCFVSEMLGEYRIHQANAGRVGRVKDAALAVVEHHFTLDRDRPFVGLRRRRRRSAIMLINAWELRKNGDYNQAIREIGTALRMWPFGWRLYAAGLLTTADWTLRSLIKKLSGRASK